MSLFSFDDYKEYLREYMQSLPKNGWGFWGRLSAALDMQPAQLSQIISGDKDFSLEQGLKLCVHLKMSASEKEFFLLLLQRSRAGSVDLKDFFQLQIDRLRKYALELKTHVTDQKILSMDDKLQFYSSWLYSAIRLYCSLGDGKSIAEIRKHYQMPESRLNQILEFLVKTDLCFKKGDRYFMGAQRTLIEKGSPLFAKHAVNWRTQGILHLEHHSQDDLFLTSPMSISIDDYKTLQDEIMQFMRAAAERIKTSKAEQLACLNIDLFKF